MVINFILPHFGLKPTGGFRIVYEYANGLAQKGHIVNIIHPSSTDDGIKSYLKYIIEIIKKSRVKNDWKNIEKNINLIYTYSIK